MVGNKRSGYQPEDFQSFFDGNLPPPGFHPITLQRAVSAISAAASLVPLGTVKRVLLPGFAREASQWARYFLGVTQAGKYDGSGLVLFYNKGVGGAAQFTLCEHAMVADPGTNREQGYFPGHCSKCGLDMSMDTSG